MLAIGTPTTTAAERQARFRALLASPEPEYLMEAHNALAGRIVEETGFPAIWASGFGIASSLGLRDSNEASWTQVIDIVEFITDATSIPVLFDGDTGFGNFNNFRRLVRKLCQRQVAAVSVEDKLFPKTNSFVGECQPLADVAEFCGKLRAGKDAQSSDAFCIVARTEALISGRGMSEALDRAAAYHEAGADAVFVHSKASTAHEVLEFAARWDRRAPLVVAPTTYHGTTYTQFRESGISMVICANHNLRASVRAMQDVSARIFRERGVAGAERDIASMRDIFRLVDQDELTHAEAEYLLPALAPEPTLAPASAVAPAPRLVPELSREAAAPRAGAAAR